MITIFRLLLTMHIFRSPQTILQRLGAPLVNNDGNVIGITTLNIAAEESDEEDLYTAVNVMELVRILDPLMIEYTSTNERTSSDSPEPEPESGQETEQEQETSEYSWIKDLSIFKH